MRRLQGGIEADTHLLVLEDAREVVMRQPRETDWDDLDHHARVLQSLALTQVPAPVALAVDASGELAGRPSLVMSMLSGEIKLSLPISDSMLRALALTAEHIHGTPLGGLEWLPPRTARLQEGIARGPDPALSPADLEVWEFVAADPSILETGPAGLVHRDYWTGNTLRVGDEVTAVLDWPGACLGPPEVDAAECAFDLGIAHGPEVGERFLDIWAEATGRDAVLARRWWLVAVINSVELDTWLPAYPHLGLDVDEATAWARRDWLRARAFEAARG